MTISYGSDPIHFIGAALLNAASGAILKRSDAGLGRIIREARQAVCGAALLPLAMMLSLVFFGVLPQPAAAALRSALVIGNADYVEAPLPNAVNDARAMAATLRDLGFDVVLVENAAHATLQTAVRTFGRQLARGGTGLFYYAGHGRQTAGSDRLVPVDSNPGVPSPGRDHDVSIDEIIQEMSRPRADRLNIVILDTCRDAEASDEAMPLDRRGERAGDLFIARATRAGSAAGDTSAGLGLFTGALLQEIAATGELSALRTFADVRAKVGERTAQAQLPEITASPGAAFRFRLQAGKTGWSEAAVDAWEQALLTATRGVQRTPSADEAFWATIENSRNPADYDAYLQQFPSGVYAKTAQERAARYRQPAPQRKAPAAPPGPVQVDDLDAYLTMRKDATVRDQPSTSARKIATLAAGTQFHATGKVKGTDWYRVETDTGEQGYVFGRLVTAEGGDQPEAKEKPIAIAPVGTWELVTPFAENSFEVRNLEQFADDVREATNGALAIAVLSTPSIKAADIRQTVAAGRAPAGSFFLSDLGASSPLFEVDNVPFLATTYFEAQALWEASRPVLQRLLEADGLYVAFAVAHPPRGIFTRRQIWRMDDFKGMRIAVDHPLMTRFATYLEASPTETQARLSQAFSEKRIDGAFASMPVGVAESLWQSVPAFYDLALALPKSVLVFNRAAYQSLPAEAQTAVLNAMTAARNRGWQSSAVASNESIGVLRAKGMIVGMVPSEVAEPLKTIGVNMEREWLKRAGSDGQAMLDAYRRSIATAKQ